VWRVLVAPIATIVAVAGMAAAPAADTRARLTIEASTGSVTSVLVPSKATLQCGPGAHGTGFLRHAAAPACAVVHQGTVTAIATRHRGPRLCVDGYAGPQRARVHGTIGGRRVDVTINRVDACGIDEWTQLLPLLGDPDRSGAVPRPDRSTTTTTAPAVTYQIARGDTLTDIAKRFHTSIAAIVAANQLTDPDHLTEGQQLVMPPPSALRIDAELVGGGTDSGFKLTLTGATPSEVVTFTIARPDGSTYTGAPHVASSEGVVTTTYSDVVATGTYRVTATGERGTNAVSIFHLVPAG
jgi:LysM repeat protein